MRLFFILLVFSLALSSLSCVKKNNPQPLSTANEKALTKSIDSILAIQNTDSDSALTLFKKGLQSCKAKNFEEGINSYYQFVVFNLCIYQNNFEEGYQTAKAYLSFAQQTNQNPFLVDANSSVALTFIARDITDSAAYYYLTAIDFAKKNNDTVSLNGIYKNIIQVYILQGDFKKGLQYSLSNLAYAYSKKDTPDLASNHSNISIIYKGLNDLEQWKNHIDESYALINYVQDPSLKLAIIDSKADYFKLNNKFDSALYFFNQAHA
jgi:hypothetical protein